MVFFAEIITADFEEMTRTEQRHVIDLLDVRLITTQIDERPIAHTTCKLRRDVLSRSAPSSSRSSCGNR